MASNDLILFLDNDVRLGVETAARLVEHLAQHPECLAVAPRVLYDADPTIIQFDSADCHYLGFMATRHADTPAADIDAAPAPTTSMVSACFLIDRRLWRGSQPFDESLGFNLEDHEFGVRARVTGHSLWVHPGATVRHGSGTAGLSYRPGQRPAEARIFYLTLNRWLIILRCYAVVTLVLLWPALLIVEVMQVGLADERRTRGNLVARLPIASGPRTTVARGASCHSARPTGGRRRDPAGRSTAADAPRARRSARPRPRDAG